jgi:protein-disulfide isomerase
MSRLDRIKVGVDLAASAAMLVAAGALIWSISGRDVDVTHEGTGGAAAAAAPRPAENVEQRRLKIPFDARAVAPGTRIALVEFSDFQCPFCGRHARETLPRIVSEYVATKKVTYVFRHLPLEAMHPQAVDAAASAACAEEQGKFWEMHAQLFQANVALTPSTLAQLSQSLKLDESKYRKCLLDMPAKIRAQVAEAARWEVNATPTFFLGDVTADGSVNVRRRLNGAHPFASFKAAIEELLDTPASASN